MTNSSLLASASWAAKRYRRPAGAYRYDTILKISPLRFSGNGAGIDNCYGQALELSEAIFVFVKVNWLLWTDLDAEHKTHRSAVPGT